MNFPNEYQPYIDAINNLPKEEIRTLNMPIGQMLKECSDLQFLMEEDMEELKQVGMPDLVFEEFPIRIEIVRLAEIHWQRAKREKAQELKEFGEFKKEVQTEFSKLKSTLRYAFRDNNDLLKGVSSAKGKSKAQLAQSLQDLSEMGLSNLNLCTKHGLVKEKLLYLKDLSSHALIRFGQIDALKNIPSQEKIFRDASAHYLKTLQNHLYQAGQFTFSTNAIRKKLYTSTFHRLRNKKYYSKN